jgi:hypothetical protein
VPEVEFEVLSCEACLEIAHIIPSRDRLDLAINSSNGETLVVQRPIAEVLPSSTLGTLPKEKTPKSSSPALKGANININHARNPSSDFRKSSL